MNENMKILYSYLTIYKDNGQMKRWFMGYKSFLCMSEKHFSDEMRLLHSITLTNRNYK